MDEKSLLYTESHEWVETSGDEVRVGITDHAQQMLGDIVFVEMPEVGKTVEAGDELLTVESPKAAASVYAPVSGEVIAINDELEGTPETINASPYEGGWLVKLKPTSFESEKGKLLDYEGYQKKLEEE